VRETPCYRLGLGENKTSELRGLANGLEELRLVCSQP
jgi:hypothetical protein